jgi:23S rRNA (cytosine1962-C5)-methyltransferase
VAARHLNPSDEMTTHSTVSLPPLRLKPNEERRLSAGHLWVFSNEIDTAATPLQGFEPGALCEVISARGKFIGYGYVNPHSLIAARVLGRDPRYPPNVSLFVHRLRVALSLREKRFPTSHYRLVYGESDGLPGLVLDRYGDVIVGQIGTAGMEALRSEIEAAVQKVIAPRALLWKNDGAARELEGLSAYVELGFGELPERVLVEEGGLQFFVPVQDGQKTGWFFDQAANRLNLRKYVRGAKVLDVFSYLGPWGLGALHAGASAATCVDGSATALALLQDNAAAQGLSPEVVHGDAFDVLAAMVAEKRKFDVVVVDPPAFIKRKKDIPKGQAAYRKLNQLAMQLLERDGLLVSCSCSYHLAPEQLLAAIQQGARHLNRFVQVLEAGGQSLDHPFHPAIPETRYLKAFFCRVLAE